MADRSRPLVLVTVGTDHHPFERLMRWTESWIDSGGREEARVFVQSGRARPPRGAEWKPRVDHRELTSLMQDAAAVVCHGGPATIMECRRLGIVPIVVPRRAAAGECVDDHQIVFASRLASKREIVLADGDVELRSLLSLAISRPASFRRPSSEDVPTDVVHRFERLVSDVVREPASRSESPARPSNAPRILFIGGWGRSGSTLLDRMLGQVPGFVSVGEIRDLWLRGCLENRLCGCGQRFADCSFWVAVGDRAFGGWGRIDPNRVLHLRNAIDRPWMAPLLVRSRTTAAFGRKLREYVGTLTRLYSAIQEVSEADVVVDSSKIATHALVLRRIPGVDLSVVHLVRDSRGVAFSWQRQVARSDGGRGGDRLTRYGSASAGLRYVIYNRMTEELARWGLPYIRLRYEDLIADPRHHVARIIRRFGIDPLRDGLPHLEDGSVILAPDHTVDGNPIRFQRGRVPLRLDEEWRARMPAAQRGVMTAITVPLLTRYGYRVRG